MDEIKYPYPKEDTYAEVFFDGTVIVRNLMRIQIRCHNFDLSQFPYDQQTCTVRYASWMHGSERIVLTTAIIPENTKVSKKHTEWDVVSFMPHFENGNSSIDVCYMQFRIHSCINRTPIETAELRVKKIT